MRRDSAAPGLLVAFFVATLVMVVAIVLLLQDGARWVDFAAIALLIAVAAVLLAAIGRKASEQEPPDEPSRRDS
jgi:membrane protein implicated in regulation of membrane protease activity